MIFIILNKLYCLSFHFEIFRISIPVYSYIKKKLRPNWTQLLLIVL